MRDFNTSQAIGIPENERVINVGMGECVVLKDNEKSHLLTFGLGPCTGISIVVKNKEVQTARLLAHVPMLFFDENSYNYLIKYLKSVVSDEIKNIQITFTSASSYTNFENLKESEIKLLAVILREFKEFGIGLKDIQFEKGSQVQISPEGDIYTFSEFEIAQHESKIMKERVEEFGGYIDPDLGIYITPYGAYMSNCSLPSTCSEEEKIQELNKNQYQKYLSKGYKISIAPSFNDPSCMAIYLKNWKEPTLYQNGRLPGCVSANINPLENLYHI